MGWLRGFLGTRVGRVEIELRVPPHRRVGLRDRCALPNTAVIMNDATGDYPSGPWTGYYQQSGRRVRQDLDLRFANGVLTGTGSDSAGRFTVRGRYRANDGQVTWPKRYFGRQRGVDRG